MSMNDAEKESLSYEKLLVWTCIIVTGLICFFTVYNNYFPSETKQPPAQVKH